ncbi:MAG: response regulator [Hydrogenophaga sp.]|uniref:response regulator n=1 Tax=Hydrogenophaga sp. TaxID=1904254 RepID=UPI0025BE92B1|nr:response regulator [Hydrogenophaga sp.]MBT9553424.1 response regulator [Hydrogenophaga sp.]
MTLTSQDMLNARILIVDDQSANVALLEDLLHRVGYTQVTSTQDPRAVASMHRKTPFDLILLDLQMPGMDGFQVMEVLKAGATEGDYLSVLVVTAQPDHKLRALQAGAKDFVSKPFDLIEVQTRIHNLIEVRLLHRQLARHNQYLEQVVQERTTELRESEARYRALTELSTDWYWEQDGQGRFTKVSGPVLEMLGLGVDALNGEGDEGAPASDGWNEAERQTLQARIASRSPFLDMVLSRAMKDGTSRQYRVSGTPMFDAGCTLIGYRGFGVEIVGSNK